MNCKRLALDRRESITLGVEVNQSQCHIIGDREERAKSNVELYASSVFGCCTLLSEIGRKL